MKFTFLLFSVFICQHSSAQDTKPFIREGDAKYFDFWLGTWLAIKDDNCLDSTSWFKVKRGPNPSSFVEEWHFANGAASMAIRAWDKTNNKWGFVWVSDNGLYQVWDAKKADGHWYIYKEFTVNGDTYLTRQGFIPQPDGSVLRISEKSSDEKKWELRFKQRLKKIAN